MVSKKTNCQPAVKASYISSFAYIFAVLVAKRRDGKNEAQGVIKKKQKKKRDSEVEKMACADSSVLNILLSSNTNSHKT